MSFLELKENIIDTGLCTRCGACVGVCPKKCISFSSQYDNTPQQTEEPCIDCKKCNKVCPGKGYAINNKIDNCQFNNIIGSYQGLYTGYSTSEEILNNCASGGLISSLLVYLFEKEMIDYAIVVVNNLDCREGYAKAIKATCLDEILMAAQSKYANVPTLNILQEIQKDTGRFAIVGLPCQLAAISSLCKLDKKLSDRIVLKVGLFCGYTYTHECFHYLFKYMGVEDEDVKSIAGWRCGGVPGEFTIIRNNGSRSSITFQEEHSLDTVLFAQNRCMLCEDCFSEYSDISVGDTGHYSYKDSFAIVRTVAGKNILKACENDKYIVLTERTIDYVLQKTVARFMHREKREKVAFRTKLYIKDGRVVPAWNLQIRCNSIASKIVVILQYLFRKEKLKSFALGNPERHLRMGKFLYLGLENSYFIRGLRKIERWVNNGN